jgi:transketolase
MIKLAAEHVAETVAMRDAYCEALIAVAEVDPRILCIDADVMYSMGTVPFARKFPERSINCGIMEANAVGLSAGLSVTGLIPFFHAFGTFATRRAYDQVFLSCAYADANVKIIGGDAGVTAAMNGGTHMPFEDMGIMRNIPHMTIIEPADTTVIRQMVPQMANAYGNFYMRSCRRTVTKIYDESSLFTVGRGVVLKDGIDLTIMACGIMVYEALKAASALEKEGIKAGVVDMFTIKPIDKRLIVDCAEKTGALVTVENHNIINGLGSAVAEVLVENRPVPMERVGVSDRFGEVGEQGFLMKKFGLTADEICKASRRVIARKANYRVL